MYLYRLLIFPLWVMYLLLRRTQLSQTGGFGKGGATAKALVTEARFNNLLNNGGSFGGDIYVQGDHHVTGATRTNTAYINGFQLTMNHGAPSPPGGGPLGYSPSHDSALGTCEQDIINGLHNAGIMQ